MLSSRGLSACRCAQRARWLLHEGCTQRYHVQAEHRWAFKLTFRPQINSGIGHLAISIKQAQHTITSRANVDHWGGSHLPARLAACRGGTRPVLPAWSHPRTVPKPTRKWTKHAFHTQPMLLTRPLQSTSSVDDSSMRQRQGHGPGQAGAGRGRRMGHTTELVWVFCTGQELSLVSRLAAQLVRR